MSVLRSIGALTLALLGLPVWAANSPVRGTGQATAAVANSCVIQSADSLNFGAYDPTSSLPRTATTQVVLLCTAKASYTLSPSSGGSQMKGAGNQVLNYGLYTDAGMNLLFGAPSYVPASLNVKDTSSQTGTLWFTKSVSAAEFAAHPEYKTTPYFLSIQTAHGSTVSQSESYYVGFLGQGGSKPTGSMSNITTGLVNRAGGVVATNANLTVSQLTPWSATSTADLYYNLVVPAGTASSNGVYTVQKASGTANLSGTASSAKTAIPLTLYARVPAGQDVTPGGFTDQVVLTLTF